MEDSKAENRFKIVPAVEKPKEKTRKKTLKERLKKHEGGRIMSDIDLVRVGIIMLEQRQVISYIVRDSGGKVVFYSYLPHATVTKFAKRKPL